MPTRSPKLADPVRDILRPPGLHLDDPRGMDSHLRLLLGLDPAIALRLGEVLRPLHRSEGYAALGFATFRDYAREDLGLEDRTARNLVRLAAEVDRRPELKQAFLEGRLPEGHVLLLAALPEEQDLAAWIERAEGLTHGQLRSALQEVSPATAARVGSPEHWRVLEFHLPGDWYAHWLTGAELARRQHGRPLQPFEVVETVVAEFEAGAPLEPDVSNSHVGLDPVRKVEPRPACQGPTCPAFGEIGKSEYGLDDESVEDCSDGLAGRVAGPGQPPAPPKAGRKIRRRPPAPANLPELLTAPLPGSHRKAARLARRLVALRQGVDVEVARILFRLHASQRFRALGFRSFGDYAEGLGLSRSTAEAFARRGRKLELRPEVARALAEGRISATQADLMEPLLDMENEAAWVEYAEVHTCRRLEDVVEVCRVMAARDPLAWAARRHRPPSGEETLQDLRDQASMPRFESALDDLATSLGGPPPGSTQTFSSVNGSAEAPDPAPASSGDSSAPEATQTFSSDVPSPDMAGATPPSVVVLRMLVPESVYLQFRHAEATARRMAGAPLTAEECLFIFLKLHAKAAPPGDRHLDRQRREALERAGWRCEVPGCSSRCNLQVHHVIFRSHGGADEVVNFCVTCAAHHLRHIHRGRLRVEGEDPETRLWEVGLEDGDPYRVFQGDRVVYAWEDEEEDLTEPREERDDRVCEALGEYRVA